jgi:site-specific recombinase XerD
MYICMQNQNTYMMNYSVKFYPEKRKGIESNVPVMLSVTYSRQRMFYYTGLRCDVKQWDTQESKMKRNQITQSDQTTLEFNSELTKITKAVNDLFKLYEVNSVIPTPSQLREDLKGKLGKAEIKETDNEDFFCRFEQYIKDAPLSKGRKSLLKSTLKSVKVFNPNVTFNSFNIQCLTDFQNHLLGVKKISKNTAISQLKQVRAFFSYSIKHEWTTNYPFKSFTIDSESYGDPIFITIQERDLLYNAKIEDGTLSIIRDIFVFQCLIGCRVGDLVKLKKSNIINGCIEYIAGKTKDEKPRLARIPLTEKAYAILSRYENHSGGLLPYFAIQDYNNYIRQLFKLENINITRVVTVADPRTRENVQKSIADLASSHMARRVFISSLYTKGVKNEIIASMSGHSENSKAFHRYYGIGKEDQMQAMKLIE